MFFFSVPAVIQTHHMRRARKKRAKIKNSKRQKVKNRKMTRNLPRRE